MKKILLFLFVAGIASFAQAEDSDLDIYVREAEYLMRNIGDVYYDNMQATPQLVDAAITHYERLMDKQLSITKRTKVKKAKRAKYSNRNEKQVMNTLAVIDGVTNLSLGIWGYTQRSFFGNVAGTIFTLKGVFYVACIEF